MPHTVDPDRHGPEDLQTSCMQMADALAPRFRHEPLCLGLYVRVKCGLHEHTRQLSAATKLFTALMRQELPGSPFLTIALIHDPDDLHRDRQNDWLPNLVLELQSSHGGGTWVEESGGKTALETHDGDILWGTVLKGTYKLSARVIRHCSIRGATPRVILVAWTPAAWKAVPPSIASSLEELGFVMPSICQSNRARHSIWRGTSLVQRTLCFAKKPSLERSWPLGSLPGTSGVTLECLDEVPEPEATAEATPEPCEHDGEHRSPCVTCVPASPNPF